MENKRKFIFWSIILAIGAGLILGLGYSRNKHIPVAQNQQPLASSTISPTPTPSTGDLGKPSGKDLQSLTPQEVEKMLNNNGLAVPTTVPYSQLNGPASCRVEGTIKFLSPTIYQDIGAKLTYSGIDSPARQIKWKVSPSEDLRIGPNLMAQLTLPDGSIMVGATLPASPQSKNYKLTASITYGRLIGEGIRVYEVNCSGEVSVVLSY